MKYILLILFIFSIGWTGDNQETLSRLGLLNEIEKMSDNRLLEFHPFGVWVNEINALARMYLTPNYDFYFETYPGSRNPIISGKFQLFKTLDQKWFGFVNIKNEHFKLLFIDDKTLILEHPKITGEWKLLNPILKNP